MRKVVSGVILALLVFTSLTSMFSVQLISAGEEAHDLDVSLDCPPFLELGDTALLNATVHNIGLNNEINVELQLLINDAVVSSILIPELLTEESYTLIYSWTPTVIGTYNITAYAPPVSGENITTNNFSLSTCAVFLAVPGDLDHDGVVGLSDLVLLAQAYGSKPGDQNWNPLADLAYPWDEIGLTDLLTLASYYGKHNA
jgi:hypothetical protein